MNLKKSLLSLVFAGMLTGPAMAQDSEGGLFLGVAQYQGDLTLSHYNLGETKPGLGLLYRYYFNPRVNFKGGLNFGWVEGSDLNYTDMSNRFEEERLARYLSFESHIFEVSGQVELNILPFISNSRRYKFAPYVFGGLSLYNFNPKSADSNGTLVELQPLGTEGQTLAGGKPYSLWQVGIPYGFGIKYSLGRFWNIGLEVGQRKLFTDYLDDVSGVVPDYSAMIAAGNQAGVDMSWRWDEGHRKKPVPTTYTALRGDPEDLDMFNFWGLTITKTFRRFGCTDF